MTAVKNHNWRIFFETFKNTRRYLISRREALVIFAWYFFLIAAVRNAEFFDRWRGLEQELALFSETGRFDLHLLVAELMSGSAKVLTVILWVLSVYFIQNLYFEGFMDQKDASYEYLDTPRYAGRLALSYLVQCSFQVVPVALLASLAAAIILPFTWRFLQFPFWADALAAFQGDLRWEWGSVALNVLVTLLILFVSCRKILRVQKPKLRET